jgi:cephalosporin hydroxylase
VHGSLTGGSWRAQFDGIRWSVFGGRVKPRHGGDRMIAIEQHKRSMGQTFDDIRAEQSAHREVIDAFHRAFYASKQTHGMTFYEGVPVLKNPLDLWVMQEILWDLQPTLLIETGTAYGGSALYYARQMDRSGVGQVLSIDIEPAEKLPQHARVTYVKGYSSVLDDVVTVVGQIATEHPRVMVVLDSDHSKRHVLAELDAYAPFVSVGQFLVVEDTNINGRPVDIDWHGGPGPGPAVDEWLPRHPEFERAVMAERYLMTFHTWLRKVE